MTNLTENSSFDAVYQLETSDRALGGPGGVMNRQAQALVNRTRYLKDTIQNSSELISEVIRKQKLVDNEFNHKINKLEQLQHDFLQETTLIKVGSNELFQTIQEAWNSLNGKILTQKVIIKVADGVYETNVIYLNSHPYAHLIQIEGNITNPEKCVIKYSPTQDKCSYGLICSGVIGVMIGGFKFMGETNEKNFTHRSILINKKSSVQLIENSIVIEGGNNGIEVNEGSYMMGGKIKISKCSNWGVVVGSGSVADIPDLKITGLGKDYKTKSPSQLVTQSIFTSNGMIVQDTSCAYSYKSHISDIGVGLYSRASSYLWCDGSKVNNAEIGAISEHNSVLWAHTASNNTPTTVTDSTTGFISQFSSHLFAYKSIAKNCSRGYIAHISSYLLTNESQALSCDRAFVASVNSTVEAYGVNSISHNNRTQYSPPVSGVSGNLNSIIFFS